MESYRNIPRFFFSSRRRHTRCGRDWSSDMCSSDLHHLVFNKGSSSGIQPGMPVIDEGGIVGQIVRVTPFTSEAALLTDDQVSIPVQVLRNGLRLIAFGGNVSGKVEVRYLTDDVDIEPGDTLITSGIGGLFPAGLPVARIDQVERDVASGFGLAVATPLSHPER